MSYRGNYSADEIQFLQSLFDGGHEGVRRCLAESTGKVPENFGVEVVAIPPSQLIRVMGLGIDPLATVSSRFSGGVKGEFLYLQTEADLTRFNSAMGAQDRQNRGGSDSDKSNTMPEWLQEQREARRARAGADSDMLASIAELGNAIFTVYSSALLQKTRLGIFQDISDTTMDEHQMVISNAISHSMRSSNLAILFTVRFSIGSQQLKFWLVMLPNPEGMDALLDCMNE